MLLGGTHPRISCGPEGFLNEQQLMICIYMLCDTDIRSVRFSPRLPKRRRKYVILRTSFQLLALTAALDHYHCPTNCAAAYQLARSIRITQRQAAFPKPVQMFPAALTNKALSLTSIPTHTLLPQRHYYCHPPPPPWSCVAPPQSLSSVLLFSHHLCLVAFPSTCIRSIIHDLLLSTVPFLPLDDLIPCTSLSSPCISLCSEVFPINEPGKNFNTNISLHIF
jgi:hypothetical protein